MRDGQQNSEHIDESINTLPTHFPLASADAPIKKRERRVLPEPSSLSITSLMDVMTILLVFLLKNYSASPVQLKQAPDLKLPFSKSQLLPAESTAVTVTMNSVVVNDVPVLRIENGVVSEADRSGGGYLIDPLFQKLQEEVDHQKKVASFNKQAEFEGLITIVADRHVPFSLLSQVMYTAGQAQFSKFKFAVVKGEG
jgi:biopolymer transport protein ExbD